MDSGNSNESPTMIIMDKIMGELSNRKELINETLFSELEKLVPDNQFANYKKLEEVINKNSRGKNENS